MNVERYGRWGDPGGLDDEGPVAASDAEVRALVEEARRAGAAIPMVGLVGGDLCRTLGGRGEVDRLRSASATQGAVDVVEVRVDGGAPQWFVAHLVARRSWWRGTVAAVMNAEFVGRWDVAPRGHPGDGRVEVFEGAPDLRTRFRIRARLSSGTHVPHPAITQRSATEGRLTFDRPLDVFLDGERVGGADVVSLRVEPDALRVVV